MRDYTAPPRPTWAGDPTPFDVRGCKSTVTTHTGSLTKVVLCPDQSELLPVASRTPPRTMSASRHVGPQNSSSHAASIVVPGVGNRDSEGPFPTGNTPPIPPVYEGIPRRLLPAGNPPHPRFTLKQPLDSPSPRLRLVTPDAIPYIRSPVESSMRTNVLILSTNQSGTGRMS